MTVEELRAKWEAAVAAATAAEAAVAEAQRARAAAELDLLRAEGRGHIPRARWIEAWLEGRHADCDHLLDLMPPRYAQVKRPATESEIAALAAEAEAMEAQS